MRSDTLEFDEKNSSAVKEPVFVIELSFDTANTDLHYLTSRPVTGLTGNIINNTLKIVSSTSQALNPEKALSTIGSIKFECLDIGLTELQKTKLDAGYGLNGKRVRVYVGYVGLLWDKFVLVQTQIISNSITYKDGVYQFSCADVQRVMRKKLFVLKSTTLTASITATDTTLQVANTSGFEVVYQPPLGTALAPGATIGIVKIESGGLFELISWTSKDSTHFYGCTRGVLNTPKLAVEVDLTGGGTGEKVEEFVYLSAPGLMIAYALITGSWYGYAGKFLPAHWHMGVHTDYVKTSDFVGIPDLWNTADIDQGISATVQGVSDEDGKQFVEEQIYYLLGVYSPINTLGELGLKRLAPIMAIGNPDGVLNADNIVDHGELLYDLKSVANRFVIQWDYSVSRDIFRRTSVLIDQDSIDTHGVFDTKVLKSRTLYGSRDSLRVINSNFDNLRSRTAAPPYRLSVSLTPDQNHWEVGDVARVTLDTLRSVTETGTGIDRNFEVQSVKTNWITGGVDLDLFGTSEMTGPLVPPSTDTIDLTFLSTNVPAGNWLTPANFPGLITSAAGVTHIIANVTLAGNSDLNNVNCIYYCDEELIIDPGVIVTVTLNAQIRSRGYFTNNGTIDGAENGYAGAIDSTTYDAAYDFDVSTGIAGGVGITRAQAGTKTDGSISDSTRVDTMSRRSLLGATIRDQRTALPAAYNLSVIDSELTGIPDSLIGTSGGAGGGFLYRVSSNDVRSRAQGGTGGYSGAGLVIISAGFNQGDSGEIDLSGGDGLSGQTYVWGSATMHGGTGGGGHAGGLLILSTDSTQYTEALDSESFILNNGLSLPPAGELLDKERDRDALHYSSAYLGYTQALENVYQSFARVIYLDALASFQEEEAPYVATEPTFSLTEQTNTPVTPEGDRSTIEVSVTPPADTNYSYSAVQYRLLGADAWTDGSPASHESLIVVPSDGATYQVRIRAVSTKNNTSPNGPINTITVTDKNGRTDEQLAVVYPFDAITNLILQGDEGSEFSGTHAFFKWDHDNGEYIYFNYYAIELYSGAQLLRAEKAVSPFYEYNYEKNAVDYQRINGVPGIYYTFQVRVKAVSKYYNSSAALYSGAVVTLDVSAPAPNAVTVTLTYSGTNAVLTWPETSSIFQTVTSVLDYNGSIIQETTGNSFTVPITWTGSRTFALRRSYLPTYWGPDTEIIVNPALPSTPTVTARVIANNVIFNYSSAAGSLAIDRFEIRRGGTYDGNQVPVNKAGTSTFTIFEESAAGTIVFWFEAVDVAGNHSGHVSISVQVAQPPNYQLLANFSARNDNWAGTKTNCLVTEANNLLLPVLTNETWGDHFTNNSWATPQDQITAGFEYYMQPSTTTAQYICEFDYLSVIDSAIISANTAPMVFDGNVSVSVTISYSEDDITYSDGTAGATQIQGTDFRYVRVTLNFTAADGDDLAYVEDVLVKIDKQIDEDFGKFNAVSTDTNGTRVYFNKDFIDAQTPSVSMSSSERIDVVVDFADVPDPEYFDVYVFSVATGLRISASGSWHVYGFTRVS